MNPSEIAAVNAVITALKNAEPGTELKLPNGSVARVDQPVPGVRSVKVDPVGGGGWLLRVFDPSATRSPVYPESIPFIPGRRVAMTEGADGHLMATWETPDIEAVFEEVLTLSKSAGWLPDGALPSPVAAPMQMQKLQRNGRARIVMQMRANDSGIVTVFDT